MRKPRTVLVLAWVLALALAACGGDTAETTTTQAAPATTEGSSETTPPTDETTPDTPDTTTPAEDVFGPAEKSTVVLANRLPDLGSNATEHTAIGMGFFEEEGLELELVNVEDVRAALVGGSVDIAVVEAGLVVDALNEGLDFVAVGGHRCSNQNFLAMQPDIETVEDLIGTDILVGGIAGTPDADFRLELLRRNGWDLTPVLDQINLVSVPGGSDAWTELFFENRLAITPFFGRHRGAMADYGANVVVSNVIEWPDEILIVDRAFLESNPNVVGRTLRALLRGASHWTDSGAFGEQPTSPGETRTNEAEVVEIMRAAGFDNEAQIAGYTDSADLVCGNLYFDEDITLEKILWDGFAEDEIPSFDEWVDLSYLNQAQDSLGLDNAPRGMFPHSVEDL